MAPDKAPVWDQADPKYQTRWLEANGPRPAPSTPEERERFNAELEREPVDLEEPTPIDLARSVDEDLGFTDTDNSTRFYQLHQARIRYVLAHNMWLVWSGTRWQVDPRAVLAGELAKDVSRDLYRQVAELVAAGAHVDDVKRLTRWAEQSAGKQRIEAAVWLARGIRGVLVDHESLDADPWALNVTNGWIDLKTGTFHPPDPDKLLTKQAPVAWDPDAHAPLWAKCLDQWLPNPEDRDYFQRLCGASIVGMIRDHILVLIWGPGGNGKGTAIGTLARTLGDYFVVPHKSLLVMAQHEQHATVKASLFRARLAVAAETERRISLNEAQVKEITGGDRMAARRLYENEWSFLPTHTLWLQTNHLPTVAGRDHGIWRRIKVLPWLTKFEGAAEDRDLSEKLISELPGILRWLVEGCLRWQQDGLGEPESVRRATADYRHAEDQISRWMSDTGMVIDQKLWITANELTDSWKRWTETNFGRASRFNEVADELERLECRRERANFKDEATGKWKHRVEWLGIGIPGGGLLPDSPPSSGNFSYAPLLEELTEQGSESRPNSDESSLLLAETLDLRRPANPSSGNSPTRDAHDEVTGTDLRRPSQPSKTEEIAETGEGCETPDSCAAYPFRSHLPLCPADDLEVF